LGATVKVAAKPFGASVSESGVASGYLLDGATGRVLNQISGLRRVVEVVVEQ
jgi:hypothetical protein